jgi:hypothetical protein
MTDLLISVFVRQCRASTLCGTIGQEGEDRLRLASDFEPVHADERDLILLDDAAVGHVDVTQIRSMRLQVGR